MTDKLSEYGWGFQVKVLSAMFTDRLFLQQVADIIQSDYFESDANSWIMDVILIHFNEYKAPPTKDVLKVKITGIENDILKAAVMEQLKDVFRYMESSDLTFVKDEILKFCKNQEIKRAIMDSVVLLKNGNFDEIKTKIDGAMKAGADTDIGLDYKTSVAARYDEAARHTITTGWDVIDDLMDGGLADGELGVVMAPAGIGKSWLLINIGANAIKAGHTVIHYTLELNKEYVGQRYDSVLTGINAQNLKNYQSDIQDKMDNLKGELIIKYYPTKSVSVMGIKAHLEKSIMLDKKPALVIVDYGDLLKINTKKDKHEALEDLYEDLRGMAGEYEIPVWTASQAGRSALEEDVIEADKIASSYGKVMVSDFLMSLSRKVEDKMSGTGRGHVIKNRFGPDGVTLPCKINTNNGQFQFFEPQTAQGKQTTQVMKTGENMVKKNLAQKFKDLGGTLG
jgi:archaellum biogenesis ATPase FlaH|tara:strand:+ start:999 stop:2354 length:1356 start_codon:yes stop_codon:yes gene_type:complete